MKPTTEFGSLPFATLEDGTTIGQSIPMMNFIASSCGMMPTDPCKRYLGEKVFEYAWGDVFGPCIAICSKKDAALAEGVKKCKEIHVPKFIA